MPEKNRRHLSDFLWGSVEDTILEHRLLSALSLIGAVTGLLTTVSNLLLHNPLVHIIVSTSATALGLTTYYLSRVKKKRWAVRYFLIAIFMSLLGLIWFGGGMVGSTPYFFFILLVAITIVIPKKFKVLFTLLCFGEIITLVAVEHYFPSLIIPYASPEQQYLDILTGFLIALILVLLIVEIVFAQYVWERETREHLLALTIKDKEAIEKAFSEIKQLRGIIPICGSCKKIRNDKGYWEQVEQYFHDNSDAEFSHGICPDCLKIIYGFQADK